MPDPAPTVGTEPDPIRFRLVIWLEVEPAGRAGWNQGRAARAARLAVRYLTGRRYVRRALAVDLTEVPYPTPVSDPSPPEPLNPS